MVALTETAALDRVLEPVAQIFTQDVAQRIADMHADEELQARLDELASKANEGRLTTAEQQEYAAYVDAIDLVGILQAKARSVVSRMPSA